MNYEIPTLEEVLLGQYAMFGPPVVYTQSHKEKKRIILTEVHENEHKRMVQGTTFGTMQSINAIFIHVFREINTKRSSCCKETLKRLIRESWYCHEGAAVFAQYLFSL